MLSRLTNIIIDYLDLNFITKRSGLVNTVKIKSGEKVKTVPIADYILDNSHEFCNTGADKIMLPDKKQTCIVYFEEDGVRAKGYTNRYADFEASLRLVGWCNMARIDLSDTSLLVANILKKIPYQLPNNDMLVKISVTFDGEEPKSPSIFSKYDYDEKLNYLSKPYDYFALKFRVKFSIPMSCVNGDITLIENPC